MAFAYPPISSRLAVRSEELARLAYELLDAHSDTQRLVDEQSNELQWRLHLDYLKDLQRLGREVLAQQIENHRRPANRQPGSRVA
jgi:hypothetical protein